MHHPSRRAFLASGLALAAGLTFPLGVAAGAGPDPEALEVQAQELATGAEAMGPAASLRAASVLLASIDRQFAKAVRDYQRQPLRRAGATAALVGAHASRWSGLPGRGWLTIADSRAAEAHDGPLQAQIRLERGTAAGEAARCEDCGSVQAVKHYEAALKRAGSAREAAGIRASARYLLAWQYAASGDQRGALLELEAARQDAERAGWPQTRIDFNHGSALRRTGVLKGAEPELTAALATPPVRRTSVLCDVARLHTASGDVDAAAESLTEAFLLTRADNIQARMPRIVAARVILPPGRAARELDEVMHGG